MSKVATRFAPSPTGALHIGGVRTALFNWLFSKNQKGTFHLRIEDTDKERSKDEHKIQIIKSLEWLGIKHDGEEYIQSTKINDHINTANKLLKNGNAYKCYCSSEEIEEQKKRARQKKLPYIYNRKWRDIPETEAPKDIKPTIRFKSKIEGSTILKDLVQGDVEIDNNTIEDFIILRNDGTPTYNLSATVDDHQMSMTHIIRGDDHKINTFKQMQIYEAMSWELPKFAHIPLIHTIEGKKLSKRDNASTLDDYSKIGIMPDALRNYLLRLGWSFEDKEIFTLEESIEHFNLAGIGKSPSKLDMSRILSMNEYYIKNIDENELYKHFVEYCNHYKERINPEKFKEVSCEPEELLRQGDVFLAKCQKLPKVKRPHPEKISPVKKFSLLHRDIRQNLISEFRGGIKLIDWQTPAKGDICEDIFSFISPGFQILANGTPFSTKDFNSFWKFLERPDLYERYRKIRAAFAWRHGSYCWWKSTIVESRYLRTKYRSASLAEFDYSNSSSL